MFSHGIPGIPGSSERGNFYHFPGSEISDFLDLFQVLELLKEALQRRPFWRALQGVALCLMHFGPKAVKEDWAIWSGKVLVISSIQNQEKETRVLSHFTIP